MRLFSFISVYDDCNNITEIYKNNVLVRKYTYDDLQQMTREIIIKPRATTGDQFNVVYNKLIAEVTNIVNIGGLKRKKLLLF